MSRRPRSPDRQSERERARERIQKRRAANEGAVSGNKWDQAPQGYEGMSVGEVAAHAPRLLTAPITGSVVNPNQIRQVPPLFFSLFFF